MGFETPTNTTDKYQWQDYDWNWLDNASMGSDPSSTVKNIYTQQGGLNKALGRSVISDWMRSQQANNAALSQKRQNLQGMTTEIDRIKTSLGNSLKLQKKNLLQSNPYKIPKLVKTKT